MSLIIKFFYRFQDKSAEIFNFKCIICGQTYEKEMSLYAHITNHSQEIRRKENETRKSKVYKCGLCNFITKSLKSLNQHRRNHLPYMNLNKENQRPTFECNKRMCLKKKNLGLKKGEKTKLKGEKEQDTWKEIVALECLTEMHECSCNNCGTCSKKKRLENKLKIRESGCHETSTTTYHCKICGEVFLNQDKLKYHFNSLHDEDAKDLRNDKKTAVTRDRSHFCGNNFENIHCDSVFRNKRNSKTHLKEKTQKICECDVCKLCFDSKKKVLKHLIKVHLKETNFKESMSNVKCLRDSEKKAERIKKNVKRKLSKIKTYKCEKLNCKFSTNQYSLFKNHKCKQDSFYECVTCKDKFSSRSELKTHMTSHGDRPYKCDQCPKCYKDKHGLGWHKKVQHDPSRLKFTCELCGKTYPFDSLLTQHINLTHAAEKQSVCDICGKNVSKTYLPMHRRTHGEKQYSCDVCQRTFLEKAYLKRHKMIHTGEKPYVCSVCGNLFRQHSTLTIHMRTHTGDRPYKCVVCENAYKTNHNLKKHYKRSGHKLV